MSKIINCNDMRAMIEAGYPELTGSPERVAQATDIRDAAINILLEEYEGVMSNKEKRSEKMEKYFIKFLCDETNTDFWIKNRLDRDRITSWFLRYVENLTDDGERTYEEAMEVRNQILKEREEKAAALAAVTVYPDVDTEKQTVSIEIWLNYVHVGFEKEYALINILKENNYRWILFEHKWEKRAIDEYGEATEIAVTLLREGYPVLIRDERLRDMVVRASGCRPGRKS